MRRKIIFSLVIAVVAASVTFFVKANSNNDKVAYQIALEQIESITNDEGSITTSDCFSRGFDPNNMGSAYECDPNTTYNKSFSCPQQYSYISLQYRASCINK